MMRWLPSVRRFPFLLEVPEEILIPGLSSKGQFPFLWRFSRWRWRVISVARPCGGGVSYRVFLVVGGTIMRSWWRLSATHVAVRVGPENMRFYFQDLDGYLLAATLVSGPLTSQQLRGEFPQARRI